MQTSTLGRAPVFAATLLALLTTHRTSCDGPRREGARTQSVVTHCDLLPTSAIASVATETGPETVEDPKCDASISPVGPPVPVDPGWPIPGGGVLKYVDRFQGACEQKIGHNEEGTGQWKKSTVCPDGATRYPDGGGVWRCKRPGKTETKVETFNPREKCLKDLQIKIEWVTNVFEGRNRVTKPDPDGTPDEDTDVLRVEGTYVGLAESVRGGGPSDVRIASEMVNASNTCNPPNCLLLEVTTKKDTPLGKEFFELTSAGGFNTASWTFAVENFIPPDPGRPDNVNGNSNTPTPTRQPPRDPNTVSGIDCDCRAAAGDYVEPADLVKSADGVGVRRDAVTGGYYALQLTGRCTNVRHNTNGLRAAWGFSPHGEYFVVSEVTTNTFGDSLHVTVYDLSTCVSFTPLSTSVVLPPADGWDAAHWGFSPDAQDRALVVATKPSQHEVRVWLVNLRERRTRVVESINQNDQRALVKDANWWFSPCGDLLAVRQTVGTEELSFRWWRVSNADFFAPGSVSLAGNVRDAWPATTTQGQVLRKRLDNGTTAEELIKSEAASRECR